MGDRSAIEWTDATWNPVRGCSRVSEGCRHCYAEQIAGRFSKEGQPFHGFARKGVATGHHAKWTGKVALVPEHLADPLRWKKPRRVFVNSMSDLFHEGLGLDAIDQVFAVMLLSPRHTFQVLTKRPTRMRNYLRDPNLYNRILAAAEALRAARPELFQVGISDPNSFPARWIWLGVSVEDQATADERIPLLLETPAAVRFVSYEPALGPVDFTRWAVPRTPMAPESAPATWAEWDWDAVFPWVPADVRQQIEKFWLESWGRGPRAWLRDVHVQGTPPIGMRMRQEREDALTKPCTGRWVHCWNNIGRLIDDEGVAHFSSAPLAHLFDPGRTNWSGLDWIIAGSESGPRARPAELEWFRSARDQAAAAGVAFFFKQWVGSADNEGRPVVGEDVALWQPRKVSLPVLDGRQHAEFPR